MPDDRESTSASGRKQSRVKEKSAAVFAVRRANYTHRRKGVFNVRSIEDLIEGGNVLPALTGVPAYSNHEDEGSGKSSGRKGVVGSRRLSYTTLIVRTPLSAL